MKKLAVLIIVFVGALTFVAPLQSSIDISYIQSPLNTPYSIQSEEIKGILKDFIETNPNRYSFNSDKKEGEKNAAEYIAGELKGYGFEESQITVQEFSAEFELQSATLFQSAQTEIRWSQNVILSLTTDKAADKIIVGCDYANAYDGAGAEGAIEGGSGVAICLALAKSLLNAELEYNIEIVFFGAGYHDYYGSVAYINKYGLQGVILMINIPMIGGENTYVYCDEIKTSLEDYFLNKGASKLPNNLALIDAEYVSGYSYSHWGMIGSHSAFMSDGKPVTNIFCGHYGGLSLANKEGSKGILNGNDSIKKMEEAYPDCYNQMAKTANMVYSSVLDRELKTAAQNSGKGYKSVLNKAWIAYLILAVIVISALAGLYFTARRLIKKYPPTQKRAKVAVFGRDYEDPGEVFSETPPTGKNYKHPFDDF